MSILNKIKEKTESVLKSTDTFLRNNGAMSGMIFAGVATILGIVGGVAMAGFPGLEGISHIASLPVSNIMLDANQPLNVAIASFGVAYGGIAMAGLSKLYSIARGGKVEVEYNEPSKNDIMSKVSSIREKSLSSKSENNFKPS